MVISRLVLRASCALALPAQFACSDPGPEECDREVTLEVAVSAGKPTFDWVPDCSLHSLIVLDAADRSVWSIETPTIGIPWSPRWCMAKPLMACWSMDPPPFCNPASHIPSGSTGSTGPTAG